MSRQKLVIYAPGLALRPSTALGVIVSGIMDVGRDNGIVPKYSNDLALIMRIVASLASRWAN